jgi:hypothetical protein
MRTIRIYAGIVSLLVLSQMVTAQMQASVSLSNMYDDNVNNNADQLKSNITMLDLSAGYQMEGDWSGLNVSYDGSFNYYESMLFRTTQIHAANIVYTRLSGDDQENRLRLAGTYSAGINRDDYTIFDHSLFSGSVEYKYFLTERFINKLGYVFRSVSFPALNDFSYTEHALMLNGAYALTQSTTAILQGDIGAKFYATDINRGGSSMRKGVMSTILPGVTQAIGMMKIGQGITDEIGLSLTARYQWNIQKQTRYLSSDYGYISDDELFDDHYGYEGLHTSVQYTQLLSETMTGKATAGLQNRLYSSLAAYDLSGTVVGAQRTDARYYLNFLLEKEFIDLGFSVKTSLDVIDNISNDAFYDYTNTAVTMEIGIPF